MLLAIAYYLIVSHIESMVFHKLSQLFNVFISYLLTVSVW